MKSDLSHALTIVQKQLADITQKAEWLLDPKSSEAQSTAQGARAFTKLFFDAGQDLQGRNLRLLVQGFDCEQIWEELEVQNGPLRQSLRKRIPTLTAAPKGTIDLAVKTGEEAVSKPKVKQQEDPPVSEPGTWTQGSADANVTVEAAKGAASGKDFFSLGDMEKFADMTDAAKWRLDEDAEESDFDLLEADDDDEEAANVRFADFYGEGAPSEDGCAEEDGQDEEKDAEDEEEEEEEEEEEDAQDAERLEKLDGEEKELEEQLQALAEEDEEEEDDHGKAIAAEGETSNSLYEMDRRLKSLEEEVQKLEEEQLQEKSWEMRGEVSARQRPLNSLLEVALDQPMTHFAARRAEDLAGDVEPDEEALEDAPGADTTRGTKFDLEALIKQRVWDEAFDDVVRKTQLPPSQRAQTEEDTVETLNFEKSRVGLGDIYAKQYEAEMLGHQTDAEKAEDKEKKEVKELFAKVMFKLDQLSNAHFTPRPPLVGTAANHAAKVPSLKMEETIPLMVSDSALQAPEEAKAPRRHQKDHLELSPDEKSAVRRTRKAARKKSLERKVEGGAMSLKDRRIREQKLQEKNKKEKEEKASRGQVKDLKKRLKASELLAQAAENAKSDISKKEEVKKQREARPENTPSAKRLKL